MCGRERLAGAFELIEVDPFACAGAIFEFEPREQAVLREFKDARLCFPRAWSRWVARVQTVAELHHR